MRFAFLGSSAAVPSSFRDTTSILFLERSDALLVDCGGSPIQKLLRLGVEPEMLTHVLITHIHADHAYGLPTLVQNLILLKRTRALPVFCRMEHAAPLEGLIELFGLTERLTFSLSFHGIEPREGVEVTRTPAFIVTASPNAHGAMPNLAVRVEAPETGAAVVYSSDTEPSNEVVRLAQGAGILIHEATFPERDRGKHGAHSTAADAGRIAARAGVRRLILAHIDAAYHGEVESFAAEARDHFGGVVEIAEELRFYSA